MKFDVTTIWENLNGTISDRVAARGAVLSASDNALTSLLTELAQRDEDIQELLAQHGPRPDKVQLATDVCRQHKFAYLRAVIAASLVRAIPNGIDTVTAALQDDPERLKDFSVPCVMLGNLGGVYATLESLFANPITYHHAWYWEGHYEHNCSWGRYWVRDLEPLVHGTTLKLISLAIVASTHPSEPSEPIDEQVQATAELCRVKCGFSSNVLHLIRGKKDATVHDWVERLGPVESDVSFEEQRNMAERQLADRKNPPYDVAAYSDIGE